MLPTSKITQTLRTNPLRSIRAGLFSRDVGDSIEKAKDIGTLSRSYSRSGEVGKKDLDFFRFKLDRTTSITAKIENEDKDKSPIAMTILDGRGNTIQGSNGKFLFRNIQPGATKQIRASLPAGTYYVRLGSAKGSKQDYEFNLTASSSIGSGFGGIGSGTNLGETENLGRLQSGRTYRESGSVGGDRDVDSYRFTVDRTSRLLAELSNNGNDDIAFRLLNASGETVRSSGNFLFANIRPGDDERLLASTLGAGTYAFVIQSKVGRNEDYSFRLERSEVTPL
ncbi:MAG: hypothetical protein KME11_07795 [Timaviella obliquedivisa GSE-PSE-MK23-08B]|jgi:hypothetical protein|nr:hypothetical protein [Timaviella obliquedivisa GSE-PSE-MK23-08B]